MGVAGATLDLTGRISPAFTYAFRKPLIAAVNGACAGLGLVQALMCDVRFAARGAKFATSFSRRGLAGEYGMTWLLPRMIGTERALDLLISGRTIDADEALAIGLVSRVTEPGEVLAAATAYARDLAANCSPTSMAIIKHQVLTASDASYEEGMRGAYRAMAALAAARTSGRAWTASCRSARRSSRRSALACARPRSPAPGCPCWTSTRCAPDGSSGRSVPARSGSAPGPGWGALVLACAAGLARVVQAADAHRVVLLQPVSLLE